MLSSVLVRSELFPTCECPLKCWGFEGFGLFLSRLIPLPNPGAENGISEGRGRHLRVGRRQDVLHLCECARPERPPGGDRHDVAVHGGREQGLGAFTPDGFAGEAALEVAAADRLLSGPPRKRLPEAPHETEQPAQKRPSEGGFWVA
jgi:hypothetical protein